MLYKKLMNQKNDKGKKNSMKIDCKFLWSSHRINITENVMYQTLQVYKIAILITIKVVPQGFVFNYQNSTTQFNSRNH